MRNVRLILSYDGTRFSGWQCQPRNRTVQGVVEEALGVILDGPIRIAGAGRTDAGVHALGQVANFRTGSHIGCDALKRGLNSLLQSDVRVIAVDDMPDSFDARRSAVERFYRYCIFTGPVLSPFLCRYAWHVMAALDTAEMASAGEHLLGSHDFASFATSPDEGSGTVREVTSFKVTLTEDKMIIIEIAANAFLRHMVRAVVGTLMEVGRGKMTSEEFLAVIQACDRNCAGITAPAHGLFLVEVRYP
jgi:tRNA pseudouridine38-40 synthase